MLRYSITSGALLLSSRGQNVNSLGAAVQYNFRRVLLLPSRERNIILGNAVQHNFRRTLLVPSREENIKRISIAWASRYSQAKILEGAKSFTMKSTRQGSNNRKLLYPKYTGCKAKRQMVQWDPQRVQLHPLHLPGYGPDLIVFISRVTRCQVKNTGDWSVPALCISGEYLMSFEDFSFQ